MRRRHIAATLVIGVIAAALAVGPLVDTFTGSATFDGSPPTGSNAGQLPEGPTSTGTEARLELATGELVDVAQLVRAPGRVLREELVLSNARVVERLGPAAVSIDLGRGNRYPILLGPDIIAEGAGLSSGDRISVFGISYPSDRSLRDEWIESGAVEPANADEIPETESYVFADSLVEGAARDSQMHGIVVRPPELNGKQAVATESSRQSGGDERRLTERDAPRGLPTESHAMRLLADQINEQSNGRIQLISFRKTNGQAAEFGGVDLYTLEWEATVEFDRCLWQPGSFKTEKHEKLSGDFSWKKWNRAVSGWEEVEEGTRSDISGEYRFEMTENGWRVSGGDVDM